MTTPRAGRALVAVTFLMSLMALGMAISATAVATPIALALATATPTPAPALPATPGASPAEFVSGAGGAMLDLTPLFVGGAVFLVLLLYVIVMVVRRARELPPPR
jgi:hypothetical protein